jgi:hypothetical protein
MERFPEYSHQNRRAPKNIAKRRVSSAVCAFGGNCNTPINNQPKTDSSKHSIFRLKVEPDAEAMLKYENSLSGRYFENENRISWEIEDDPPVELPCKSINTDATANSKRKSPGPAMDDTTPSKKNKVGESLDAPHSSPSSSTGDQPKMRYRCKLCGQPKQNHTCPYQQSLQRNIGIMVYPAVNSFTALEPGRLAPSLSEMNNFINGTEIYASENMSSCPSPVPLMTKTLTAPTPMVMHLGTPHVTPDTIRYNPTIRTHLDSSESMPSPANAGPRTPYGRHHRYGQYPMHMSRRPTPVSVRRKGILSPEKKSTMSRDSHKDILFMQKYDLRPEQYRNVSTCTTSSIAFQYPSLPLPYKQRKTLSENLFALSKEVPQLTDECASVLRQAREQDKWDLAVAELLTQVIVVVHCPEEDSKLDGLRKYLLTLGFAC